VRRVYDIEAAIWMSNHHVMPADKNKFRVRHGILAAVRSTDDGPLARGQVLTDQVAIHTDLFAQEPRAVKCQLNRRRRAGHFTFWAPPCLGQRLCA